MIVFAYSPSLFGQVPQERINQPIIINGQEVDAVVVVQSGTILTQTCRAPQSYVTVDQSSSGWECFDASTGLWLLNARPPAQAAAPQQPPSVVYSQTTPVYVPSTTIPSYYSYPYTYYP